MKVSIIIPCFNAERTLRACLDSLLRQDYTDYEVIAVDDVSTDSTPAILKGYRDRIRVKRLTTNSGPSVARNAGADLATGELLIFMDTDCTASDPRWIQKHVEAHKDGAKKLVGSYIDADEKGMTAKAFRYNNWHVCHKRLKKMPFGVYHLQSTNLSVRKSHYKEMGGFAENLRTCEDIEFAVRARRHGLAVEYIPTFGVEHLNRTSFRQYLQINFFYGKSRMMAKRMGAFPMPYLLPENLFLNALMILPLTGLLTARVVSSWIRYDWRIFLYFPLVLVGQFIMVLGVFKSLPEEKFGRTGPTGQTSQTSFSGVVHE